MAQSGVGIQNRGSTADYALGTAEGWDAFQVVRWHAIEEISRPFQYDITLMLMIAKTRGIPVKFTGETRGPCR